jgi:hypothetical protein
MNEEELGRGLLRGCHLFKGVLEVRGEVASLMCPLIGELKGSVINDALKILGRPSNKALGSLLHVLDR